MQSEDEIPTNPDSTTRFFPSTQQADFPDDSTAAVLKSLPGRYEIIRTAGKGGMGVVFEAVDRQLSRPVALKINLPGADEARFLREAQAVAQIRSPHVVTIYDFQLLENGFSLIAMEWIQGSTLLQRIPPDGPLPESLVIPWMRQTCEGMIHAEEQRIVHRDLKPSNLLIDQQENVHVADFGLARLGEIRPEVSPAADEQGTSFQTVEGVAMGTPQYMAPEQAEDAGAVDVRADVYSFGATFYHALTGSPPFVGSTIGETLVKHRTEPLQSPASRNPALSSLSNDLLERCLAKNPQTRFHSFRDVLAVLSSTSENMSAWQAFQDPMVVKFRPAWQSRRELYLNDRANVPSEGDVYSLGNGRVLRILVGNLADQQVRALVSSDDSYLSMGGGVSAALAIAGGPAYEQEARKYLGVRPGRVVVTSAGDMKASLVLHAVTMGGVVTATSYPTRDLIFEILEGCFYHADSLFVEGIAFPLLGTGLGGLSEEVCLDAMFSFLIQKLAQGATSVHEARIVLHTR